MNNLASRWTLVLALGIWGAPASAQQGSLVGAWQVSFPSGMRVENGVQTLIMATGVLTIQSRGDSLIGELATDPSPGVSPKPPGHLAGKAGSGNAVLVSRSNAKVKAHGSEREVVMISTWTLAAKGDQLSGTVERVLEGLDVGTQGANPVSGTRRKS